MCRLGSLLSFALIFGALSVPTVTGQESADARQQAQEESDEVRTVRMRLRVMRQGVEVLMRHEKQDLAEVVEHAMHARELILAGREDDEAMRIRNSAPDRGRLAETLAVASVLCHAEGQAERGQELHELAKTYAEQWRRRQQAEREDRTRERQRTRAGRVGDLESLEWRVDILRTARKAFAETGSEGNEEALVAAIHLGELLLAGNASDEAVSRAMERVPSQGNLIELLVVASRLWGEWGHEARARECRALADYYRSRMGEEPRREEPHGEERAGGDIQNLERRIEILRTVRIAWAEAGEERNVKLLERFLHGAELQLAGASAEEILRAFEGLELGRPAGPERVVELIAGASRLWAEWGHERNAAACEELAGFYRQRWNLGERQRWDLGEWNLEDRSHRMEALEVARETHARAGHADAADLLGRAIRVAELQQKGAAEEEIAQAAEGLSNELLIGLLDRAVPLCREQGRGDGAVICEALADYYRRRGEVPAPEERARERETDEDLEISRLMRRLEELQAELASLRAELHELRQARRAAREGRVRGRR